MDLIVFNNLGEYYLLKYPDNLSFFSNINLSLKKPCQVDNIFLFLVEKKLISNNS